MSERCNRHRLALIELGECLLEVTDLLQIIEGDIRVGGIPQEEILVVVLGPEKPFSGSTRVAIGARNTPALSSCAIYAVATFLWVSSVEDRRRRY